MSMYFVGEIPLGAEKIGLIYDILSVTKHG
jgi:hypothetical protein